MKRRDFFKRIVSTCLVLVPGVKVVEPKNTRIKYFPPIIDAEPIGIPEGIINMKFTEKYSASKASIGYIRLLLSKD